MAEPMMAPATMPPPIQQPKQRASAGVVVVKAPAAMVAAAAIAKKVFLIVYPPGSRPAGADRRVILKPDPALVKEAGLICRKFDAAGSPFPHRKSPETLPIPDFFDSCRYGLCPLSCRLARGANASASRPNTA